MNKTKLKIAEIKEKKSKIPYQELDENILWMVEVLNSFDDIYTTDSCGGHKDTSEEEWYVIFKVNQSKRGWISLEFLVWYFNNVCGGDRVSISAFAPPPFVNGELGSCMYFILEGKGDSPDEVAESLEGMRDCYYKESVWSLGETMKKQRLQATN